MILLRKRIQKKHIGMCLPDSWMMRGYHGNLTYSFHITGFALLGLENPTHSQSVLLKLSF